MSDNSVYGLMHNSDKRMLHDLFHYQSSKADANHLLVLHHSI